MVEELQWRGVRLRASPAYCVELVASDQRMSHALRELSVARGLKPESIFAVLASHSKQAVAPLTRSETLLLYALHEPTWDESLFVSLFGADYMPWLADLVALRALEIVGGQPGASAAPAPRVRGVLASLSNRAIEHASHFDEPVSESAHRLYAYNSVPVLGRLRRVSTFDAYLSWLCDRNAASMMRHVRSSDPAWIRMGSGSSPRERRIYKLYVSVRAEQLPRALEVLSRELLARARWEAKVAGSPIMLGRPDKLVVYFDDLESMHAVVSAVAPAFEELSAQGVPFTAPASASGALSWARDPAPRDGIANSWRQRLVHLVASALASWKHERARPELFEHVQTALAASNIDSETWTPQGSQGL